MIRAGFDDRSRQAILRRSTGEGPVRELAPRWDWSTLCEAEHVAQFYETDEFLVRTLSDFIATGLRADDAVLAVATEAHRDDIDVLLREAGLDPAAARASGQYIALDASEMLATFMRDGSPEPRRFAEVVGGIIARAGAGRRRVRVFGEMVALLWAEGNHAAAQRLEELWNQLHESQSFMLFCAYPMHSFGGEALAGPLADVCGTHTRALPTESYTALLDPDDRLRAIVQLQQQAGMLKAEIAERKRTEAALRSVQDELEQAIQAREQLLSREQAARTEAERANRLKDEFLAIVSHELRTPLTAILGWTQRLRRGRLEQDKAVHALEVIEKSAMAQARLIDDILDASRVITGNLGLMVEQVDAAAAIDTAVDSMQAAADAKGVHVEVTVDRSAHHIHGDAERLQQIIWNLLANAIKFTPSGGHVVVRLERAGAGVRISVRDTGEGIGATDLPFIFDHFRQADSTSSRRHGGLGLGLAIVRHLVELHGGSVHAESPGEGRGTTFTISLPQPSRPDATIAAP